jgi:hypothetical protein
MAREQVRVALLGTGGSARHSVDVARQLTGPMLGVRAALERGELSYDHARVMVLETARMDPAGTAAVAQNVLEDLTRRA